MEDQLSHPRVKAAAKEKDAALRELFSKKNLPFPPRRILLLALKREAVLEVWTADGPSQKFVPLKTYRICSSSGELGPKRRSGDEQVPEGFYEIDHFNPESAFLLSLHVSYPNASDRVFGSHENPGGDIFVHGNCVTIGCLPITDDSIKEVYWLALLAKQSGQAHIPIWIFPTRLTNESFRALAQKHRQEPDLVAFWANLKEGFDFFDKDHQLPLIKIAADGPIFSRPQRGSFQRLASLDNWPAFASCRPFQSATMNSMRNRVRALFLLAAVLFLAASLPAQTGTGAIDLSARVTPTGAQPEPVRQFTLYVLTRSYADIVKEVESQDTLPNLDEFVEKWSCSPELKKWMKDHKTVDLTSPELDQIITPDDIMNVPEFFDAYERSNSGGVTKGLPHPKYKESDKQTNPDRYNKEHDEWLAATRHFIETNTYTVQGIELQLMGASPKPAWEKLHIEQRRRVAQVAPDTAQLKYLAAKMQTDLDGHALIDGLPAGTYWISSLNSEAASGDRRLVWDVQTNVAAGKVTRLELSNLNATAAWGKSAN